MSRKGVRAMLLGISFALVALLGLMALVRLAPSLPADWHTDPVAAFPAGTASGQVVALTGGALLHLPPEEGDPAALLARLDAIATADPRTIRAFGAPEEGRVTWITRSALWGFPDYTTAEARPDGLWVHARLRFGQSDLGVNAARLAGWLASLRAS